VVVNVNIVVIDRSPVVVRFQLDEILLIVQYSLPPDCVVEGWLGAAVLCGNRNEIKADFN
jgi:hypothetical protein